MLSTHPFSQLLDPRNDTLIRDALQDARRAVHGTQATRHAGHVDAGQEEDPNGRHPHDNHKVDKERLALHDGAEEEDKDEVQNGSENGNKS